MLTFCELVSGLILGITKFAFDARLSKDRERHFLDRFFKFVSLLVKNIVIVHTLSIGVFRTRGLSWSRFALHELRKKIHQ